MKDKKTQQSVIFILVVDIMMSIPIFYYETILTFKLLTYGEYSGSAKRIYWTFCSANGSNSQTVLWL